MLEKLINENYNNESDDVGKSKAVQCNPIIGSHQISVVD